VVCDGYPVIFLLFQASSAGIVSVAVTSSALPVLSGTARMRAGEDVEAEVAAAFGPFVVLFGQDGADESDQASRSGKIPTTSVRRRISRLSRSEGLFDQSDATPPSGTR
jgi:hypothetical protein